MGVKQCLLKIQQSTIHWNKLLSLWSKNLNLIKIHSLLLEINFYHFLQILQQFSNKLSMDKVQQEVNLTLFNFLSKINKFYKINLIVFLE